MAEIINQYFQEALNYFLVQKGFGSQSYFARKTGVSQQTISLIARGKAPGKEGPRRKIAEATGFSYEEFLSLGKILLEANKIGGPDELFRKGIQYFTDESREGYKKEVREILRKEFPNLDGILSGKTTLEKKIKDKFVSILNFDRAEDIFFFGKTYLDKQPGIQKNTSISFPRIELKTTLHAPAPKRSEITGLYVELLNSSGDPEWIYRMSKYLTDIEKDPELKAFIEKSISMLAEQTRMMKKAKRTRKKA